MKTRYHKLLSNNKGDRRSGKSSDSKTVSLLSLTSLCQGFRRGAGGGGEDPENQVAPYRPLA